MKIDGDAPEHIPGHDPESAWPDLTEIIAPEAAAAESAQALATVHPPLEHHDLLAFYDRLREQILHGVQRHGGKLSEAGAEALLLVPDVFILLVRLVVDKEVQVKSRALIAGTLAYFILPFDLLPEAIFGIAGYLDDLVLAAAVLSQVFSGELEPYARKHWSGQHDLPAVLHKITSRSRTLLGERLYGRLRSLLSSFGVDLKHP